MGSLLHALTPGALGLGRAHPAAMKAFRMLDVVVEPLDERVVTSSQKDASQGKRRAPGACRHERDPISS